MREKNDCLIIGHTSIESYRDLETVISCPLELAPSTCCLALLLAFPLLAGGGAAGLPTADLMTC